MRNSLSGKVALITGASAGIGLASAHELAAEGVRLFITGRRGAEIADAARAIGRGTVGVQADVSSLADLDRLYDQISRDAGRLDVVFANAGGGDMLPLEAITAEHVDRIFGTNVKGLLFTVQKALPLMKEGGSVILCLAISRFVSISWISSTCYDRPHPRDDRSSPRPRGRRPPSWSLSRTGRLSMIIFFVILLE